MHAYARSNCIPFRYSNAVIFVHLRFASFLIHSFFATVFEKDVLCVCLYRVKCMCVPVCVDVFRYSRMRQSAARVYLLACTPRTYDRYGLLLCLAI